MSMTTAWFFLLMAIMDRSTSSARTLSGRSTNHNHAHSSNLTFVMLNVLNGTQPSARPSNTGSSQLLPFPKPLGFLPPARGIPVPQSNPLGPGFSTQPLDLSSIGLSFFPAAATLQELQFGTVVTIDEDLYKGPEHFGSFEAFLGKAQGLYIASSEDGSSHMMAMAASFASSQSKDILRFFGVYRTTADDSESHIAVIGGTGKYQGANGYATLRAVVLATDEMVEEESEAAKRKLLLFHVYLS